MPAGSGGDRDCLPPLRRDFRYEASKLRPAPGAGGAAAASLDPTRLAPLPASVTRLEADRAAGRNRALDASPAGAPDRGGSGRRPGPGSCKRLADHLARVGDSRQRGRRRLSAMARLQPGVEPAGELAPPLLACG